MTVFSRKDFDYNFKNGKFLGYYLKITGIIWIVTFIFIGSNYYSKINYNYIVTKGESTIGIIKNIEIKKGKYECKEYTIEYQTINGIKLINYGCSELLDWSPTIPEYKKIGDFLNIKYLKNDPYFIIILGEDNSLEITFKFFINLHIFLFLLLRIYFEYKKRN